MGAGQRAARVAAVLRSCGARDAWTPQTATQLVAGLRDGDIALLIEQARRHGMVGAVYRGLRHGEGLPRGALSPLEAAHRAGVAWHMRVLADLRSLKHILDAAGVPWLVFKGPVLAELCYPAPDARLYGDLDILVPAQAFAAAVEALESSESILLDRNWSLIHAEQRGQLHLVLRLGTVVDLHWHLLNRARVRRSFAVDIDDVFARSVTVDLAGLDVATLSAADTVVHLCLHAGLAGGYRLQWMSDIGHALEALTPEWDEVVARALQWRARRLTGVMLLRARRTVGAPVPDDALARLLPSRAGRTAIAALDRLWPPARARGPHGPGALAIQLLRDSAGAMAASVLARAGARAQRTVRRGSFARDAFSPGGDVTLRGSYLRGRQEPGLPGSDERPSRSG